MDIHAHTPDRRVKKTKKAIKAALAELLKEKSVPQITIKELADRADINRNTFYGHYQNIDDVIAEIENDILQDIKGIISKENYIEAEYNPYTIFDRLTQLINADFDFYSQLAKSDNMTQLIIKVKNALRDMMIEAFNSLPDESQKKIDIVIEFACAGTFAVYQEWFLSPGKLSIESISEEISNLSRLCMGYLECEA